MTRQGRGINKLGALLLCLHDKLGQFHFSGKVGTRFSEEERKLLFNRLIPLKIDAPPLRPVPHLREEIDWLEPKTVVQTAYREFTADGLLRGAVFQGIREDLEPDEVHGEPIHALP